MKVVLMVFVASLCGQSKCQFFLSRSLWSEPMDMVVSASETHDSSNTNVQSHLGHPGQRVHQPNQQLYPFNAEPTYYFVPSSNYSSNPSPPVIDDLPPISASHVFDKSILELLTSSNFTIPLGSEKFFWLSEQNIHKAGPQVYDSSQLLNSESIKVDDVVQDLNVKYAKVVSLCDKTLAITDLMESYPIVLVDLKDKKNTTQRHDVRTLIKCELFDLEKNPDKAYAEAKKTGTLIQQVSFEEMRNIINSCREMAEPGPELSAPIAASSVTDTVAEPVTSSNSSSTGTSVNTLWTFWRALLPGTKWCGLGDSAANYHDLGKRKDVDVCCRAHDHCPIRLKALRVGYGLINLSLYTKSHCECDEDFLKCLRTANSKISEMLGNFYFNIMKVQCIKQERNLICKEYSKLQVNGKHDCIKYEEDVKMAFTQPETTFTM